jgi:hypothetical protein
MGVLTTVRDILELAYFASGIALVIIAAVGLYQLKLLRDSIKTSRDQLESAVKSLELAKHDLKIRNQREAITLAAQQSQRYAEEILPFAASVADKLTSNSIRFYPWPLANLDFDKRSLIPGEDMTVWLKQIVENGEMRAAALNLLNHYEGFSLYFVTGAADESVVYPAIGKSFCNNIAALAPLLVALREGQISGIASGGFEHLVRLYGIWTNRDKKKALERAHNAIGLELKEARDDSIPPIGTDDSWRA